MFDLLHELSDWTLSLAESEWALVLLVLVAFSESIFFPIPPDPLLIAIGIADPPAAIWAAALATLASVAGGVVGHYLGRRVGRPLLYKFVSEDKVSRAEALFERYGAWAILAAAITPIPYKVFTILAGVMNLRMRPFLLASLVGRSIRIMTVGVLIYLFGESVREFIDHNFELLTVGAMGMMIVMVLAYLAFRRMRFKTPLETE